MTDARDGEVNPLQGSGYKDRFWFPRFWYGMCVRGWFSLLARNRFAIAPRRLPMALTISVLSVLNSLLGLLEFLLYGRSIRRMPVEPEPIFVVGHWRAGTTLLHELLVLDPRHAFPDTYACFAPGHFLASGRLIRPVLQFLLPPRRPMDNMAVGWDLPQEDEFALCNLGARSPYLTLAFPNHPPQDQEYIDFEGVSARALARWRKTFLWFLKRIALQGRRRIVLKSPQHTARIRVLLEMFPKAKFVHIVRDPHTIFPSAMNLWKRLYRDEGLQVPAYEGLAEHVFVTLARMYEAFDRDCALLGLRQFCEIRYEDLIANPLEQMRLIYDRLELGEFETAAPAIEQYAASHKDYRPNRYQITPEMRAEVARRWGRYLKHYGYVEESASRNGA